jgi:ATP-dependent protease ClpP protease subunit
MTKMNAQNEYDGIAYVGFFATIEAQSMENLVDVLTNKLPENTHTIYMLLCLNGGSVQHGFAIYNLLRGLPYKIIMHNIGSVDSIGNVVFMAAKERYATENGTFLIHRVSTRFKDSLATASLIQEKLNCVEADEVRIRDIMTRHSKITAEEHNRLFEYGEAKDSTYALAKGMIHEIREVKIPAGKNIIVVYGGGGDDNGNF